MRNKWAPHVVFIVFDAPEIEGCWSKRIAVATKKLKCGFAAAVPWLEIEGIEHASRLFRDIRLKDGEALIVRRPGVPYSTRRNDDVLKIKACPLTGELRWQERRRVA
jgi:hypothetical protein